MDIISMKKPRLDELESLVEKVMVQQNKIKERHGALMKKMAASPRRAQLEVELKAKRAELDRMTTEYQSKVNATFGGKLKKKRLGGTYTYGECSDLTEVAMDPAVYKMLYSIKFKREDIAKQAKKIIKEKFALEQRGQSKKGGGQLNIKINKFDVENALYEQKLARGKLAQKQVKLRFMKLEDLARKTEIDRSTMVMTILDNRCEELEAAAGTQSWSEVTSAISERHELRKFLDYQNQKQDAATAAAAATAAGTAAANASAGHAAAVEGAAAGSAKAQRDMTANSSISSISSSSSKKGNAAARSLIEFYRLLRNTKQRRQQFEQQQQQQQQQQQYPAIDDYQMVHETEDPPTPASNLGTPVSTPGTPGTPMDADDANDNGGGSGSEGGGSPGTPIDDGMGDAAAPSPGTPPMDEPAAPSPGTPPENTIGNGNEAQDDPGPGTPGTPGTPGSNGPPTPEDTNALTLSPPAAVVAPTIDAILASLSKQPKKLVTKEKPLCTVGGGGGEGEPQRATSTPTATVDPAANPGNFKVGDRVEIIGYTAPGTIMWIGMHASKGTPRCGIALDEPKGKSQGKFGGFKYFNCLKLHGILVGPKKVTLLSRRKRARVDSKCSNGGTSKAARTASTLSARPPSPEGELIDLTSADAGTDAISPHLYRGLTTGRNPVPVKRFSACNCGQAASCTCNTIAMSSAASPVGTANASKGATPKATAKAKAKAKAKARADAEAKVNGAKASAHPVSNEASNVAKKSAVPKKTSDKKGGKGKAGTGLVTTKKKETIKEKEAPKKKKKNEQPEPAKVKLSAKGKAKAKEKAAATQSTTKKKVPPKKKGARSRKRSASFEPEPEPEPEPETERAIPDPYEEGKEYVIERIVAQKGSKAKNTLSYEIKWEGYDNTPYSTSWEPAENIPDEEVEKWKAEKKAKQEEKRRKMDELTKERAAKAAAAKKAELEAIAASDKSDRPYCTDVVKGLEDRRYDEDQRMQYLARVSSGSSSRLEWFYAYELKRQTPAGIVSIESMMKILDDKLYYEANMLLADSTDSENDDANDRSAPGATPEEIKDVEMKDEGRAPSGPSVAAPTAALAAAAAVAEPSPAPVVGGVSTSGNGSEGNVAADISLHVTGSPVETASASVASPHADATVADLVDILKQHSDNVANVVEELKLQQEDSSAKSSEGFEQEGAVQPKAP
eukprot:gene16171-8575_t